LTLQKTLASDPRPIPPVFLTTRDLFPLSGELQQTDSPTTCDLFPLLWRLTCDPFPLPSGIPRPIPPVTRDLFPLLWCSTRDLFPLPSGPSSHFIHSGRCIPSLPVGGLAVSQWLVVEACPRLWHRPGGDWRPSARWQTLWLGTGYRSRLPTWHACRGARLSR